jgi:hypothetical protein
MLFNRYVLMHVGFERIEAEELRVEHVSVPP